MHLSVKGLLFSCIPLLVSNIYLIWIWKEEELKVIMELKPFLLNEWSGCKDASTFSCGKQLGRLLLSSEGLPTVGEPLNGRLSHLEALGTKTRWAAESSNQLSMRHNLFTGLALYYLNSMSKTCNLKL